MSWFSRLTSDSQPIFESFNSQEPHAISCWKNNKPVESFSLLHTHTFSSLVHKVPFFKYWPSSQCTIDGLVSVLYENTKKKQKKNWSLSSCSNDHVQYCTKKPLNGGGEERHVLLGSGGKKSQKFKQSVQAWLFIVKLSFLWIKKCLKNEKVCVCVIHFFFLKRTKIFK